MKTLRLQFVSAIAAAVAIGFMLTWADRTVHGFADGKVSESQFETALAINGWFGIPLQFILFAVAALAGGFSISMNGNGSIPLWLILLAGALWAVIIFIGLRVATRIWRKLEQGPQSEKA